MKKNKLRIIVSLLLLIAIPSFAQKITIQEAAEMAIKNNKDIKIGMLKAEQGKINVDKAWASKFFTVGYSGKAQEFLDKDFSKKGEAFQHYLTLSQPIYTGGKLKLNHEISKESLTLAQLNLDKVRKDTILSTVQAYIDVYNAMSTLGVLQKSKETLNENLKTQKELYDLRMTTKPELTEAERSLSSIEAQIVEQEGNIEVSKESLGILIGMKDSSQIEIVPFGVEDNFTKTVKLEDDLSKLKTENTEYKISMKQNDLSKKNVKLEEASYKPTVSGVINYGTLQSQDRFGNILKPRNFTTSAGVNWSWDIFDWGTRKNNVKYAKKTQEITELQVDQTLEVVQTNMKKTYYQLRALEKSIAALQLAVQKAEESYEMERERYSYRLITMENLLQSETNLRQARVNYAQAKLNYYFLVSKYGAYLD
ncbi:TolC family protein [Leptotrichia sp. oral taxon 221]|jgi:outer membrane efflux protein|uniref:TolC family protein n=1 Tax=Leptotrichia sp. oral taxon 221 TaxID=712362 RepID=UPI001B8B8310|nr:TolC family protein [Leptotrichia sp. oral taxon 221]QUB97065.1 TolC family protein [Leptotrichia sp. oral taxon 221]